MWQEDGWAAGVQRAKQASQHSTATNTPSRQLGWINWNPVCGNSERSDFILHTQTLPSKMLPSLLSCQLRPREVSFAERRENALSYLHCCILPRAMTVNRLWDHPARPGSFPGRAASAGSLLCFPSWAGLLLILVLA